MACFTPLTITPEARFTARKAGCDLLSAEAALTIDRFDREEESWARRNDIIAPGDNYGWRVEYINRKTGAFSPIGNLPFRTRLEALEYMHNNMVSGDFIASGIFRTRTHFESLDDHRFVDRVMPL